MENIPQHPQKDQPTKFLKLKYPLNFLNLYQSPQTSTEIPCFRIHKIHEGEAVHIYITIITIIIKAVEPANNIDQNNFNIMKAVEPAKWWMQDVIKKVITLFWK